MSPRPREEPSGSRRRLPRALILGGYWVAFGLLQFGTSALTSRDGVNLWYYPTALSVFLLMMLGPKVLPAVILAPLPLELLLRPLGVPAWTTVGLSFVYGCGYAVAVMAFRRTRFSSRLHRVKDVAAFLALAFLGPLLATGPAFLLLRASGTMPPDRLLECVRTLLVGHALGVLALTPALLIWARPFLTLGRLHRQGFAPPFRRAEFLVQCVTLVLAAVLVPRASEPGTLHLKYLFFLPMTWLVLRGGLRAASLGVPLLTVALTLALLGVQPAAEALLGLQSFLVVLIGTALFMGSGVDAHASALEVRDRRGRHFDRLLEVTGAIPWELDLETGRCDYLGSAVEPSLGWPPEVWRRKPFWGDVIHPDDQTSFLRFLQEVSRPGGARQLEFRLRAPDGGEHWVRAAGGVESAAGQGRVMGFLFDIHAHKFAEEHALRASLKEKDLLLREIHHRVKNNLQVVSSLLRLQAATYPDPAIQKALQEAQERVHAIALIHQKLKHAPDFSQLDLPEYVQALAERLVRTYASRPALIDLHVGVADVEIGPDAPVPLGLILNELVANALQHAFPPGEGGSLDIEIDRDPRGWITLRVADSGLGLPESVDLDRGGLGFQLVRALTDQLGGVLELERRRGASFLLSFPPSP